MAAGTCGLSGPSAGTRVREKVQVAAEFVTSAAGAAGFPHEPLAEVAMLGRSNVGKSSLINALVRQTVARTSAAPGKTRLANFYKVRRGSGPAIYLVDLPGYGYARGPDGAREFETLARDYFDRPGTRGVLLLVDARHPGLDSDVDAWAWLREQACPARVIGTKADKLTRAERVRHARQLESMFELPVPLVSARDGEGLDDLWKLIAQLPKPTAA